MPKAETSLLMDTESYPDSQSGACGTSSLRSLIAGLVNRISSKTRFLARLHEVYEESRAYHASCFHMLLLC